VHVSSASLNLHVSASIIQVASLSLLSLAFLVTSELLLDLSLLSSLIFAWSCASAWQPINTSQSVQVSHATPAGLSVFFFRSSGIADGFDACGDCWNTRCKGFFLRGMCGH
jgi:hypothetical protein